MRDFKLARPAINPIIVKEVRAQMRGVRPYAILSFFLIVLVAVGYAIYQTMLQQARFGATLLSAQVGQMLFNGLALCELFLVVFLAPALTSSAISGEREQLTYDLLVATPLRPERILWGKLIAALSYLFLLIFASIPIFSVVLMFGGVAPTTMIKALTLLIVTTITYGTIGLVCSALFRRSLQATIASYIVVLLLIGGTASLGAVWGEWSGVTDRPLPPQLLYANPFSALLSIIATTPAGGAGPFFGISGDAFSDIPLFALLSPGVIYYGPNGPVVLPIYRGTLVFSPVLIVILCWIGSHLVLPRQRWRPRWSDLRFAVISGALLALLWLTRTWWFVAPPVAI